MLKQGRRAVKKWLRENGLSLVSIRRSQVFKDCGSPWVAIFLLEHDYDVVVLSPDGKEQKLGLVVEFVPILGLFKEIRNLELAPYAWMDGSTRQ